MKLAIRSMLIVTILAAALGTALGAVQLQATYTGDNVVAAFYKDGLAPQAVDGFVPVTNWRNPATTSFTLDSAHTYDLIFRVYNDNSDNMPFGDPGNPAGFLAQLTGPVASDTDPDTMLTSGAWSYAVDPGKGSGDVNWSSLTWSQAFTQAYEGANAYNGGSNIWSSVAGKLTGISGDAQWIWGDKNGVDLGPANNPDPENWLFIRTTITIGAEPATTIIPEPATMIVWSLLGASWLGIRVWRRGRGPAGRQPWSPENRQAIYDIIAHGSDSPKGL